MRKLNVHIEVRGKMIYVGCIEGENSHSAVFRYSAEYLQDEGAQPISIGLPLTDEAFSPEMTGNFFEGLLPEGFTRRSVATWLHADEKDYLSILAGLGAECLGAIRILEDGVKPETAGYLRLNRQQVKELASEGAEKSAQLVTRTHLSLTGASGKVGLYYDEEEPGWYLPKGDAPSTHIIKQSHVRLGGIVTNEQLCMTAAAKCGIEIPESHIWNLNRGRDSEILFVTKRYDRIIPEHPSLLDGKKRPERLHQEDFSQALGISAAEKYEKHKKGYLKNMFSLLRGFSANPIQDQVKLWRRIVFSYLIGNTDAHVKNFSLLYSPDLRSIRLAPAYDLVSTTVYDSCTREMSFYIGEKCVIDELKRADFLDAAEEAGIGKVMAMKEFDRLCEMIPTALSEASYELKEQGFADAVKLKERICKLFVF